MGNIIVPVDSRLYSTLKIGSNAFPFMYFQDDLSNFAQGFVNWHKQEEIEISYILEGSVKVCLLKEEHLLHAGDGFVIFPGALHSIQPVAGRPGRYSTLIFHPRLLTGYSGSFFDQTWYSPVLLRAGSYHALRDLTEDGDIRRLLLRLFALAGDSPKDAALDIQRSLQDVWILIAAHICSAEQNTSACAEDRRILDMIDYLRCHYAEKFSLAQMAEYIHISRGECCRYFKKMMGMTLTEYLIDYRLSKAAELLTDTQAGVAEIALQTGFCSPSSFSAEFRKKTGLTPTRYRLSAAKLA